MNIIKQIQEQFYQFFDLHLKFQIIIFFFTYQFKKKKKSDKWKNSKYENISQM